LNFKNLGILFLILLTFACEKESLSESENLPEEMQEEMETDKTCIITERIKFTTVVNSSTGEKTETIDTLPVRYDNENNIVAYYYDNNDIFSKWDTIIYDSQKPKFVNRYKIFSGEKNLESSTEKFYYENGLLQKEVKTEGDEARTILVIDSFAYDDQVLSKRSRIQESYSESNLTGRFKLFEEEYEFEDDNLITTIGRQFDFFDLTRVTNTYTTTYSNYTTYKNPWYRSPIPELFVISLSKNRALRIKTSSTNGSFNCSDFSDEGANENNYPNTQGKYECY